MPAAAALPSQMQPLAHARARMSSGVEGLELVGLAEVIGPAGEKALDDESSGAGAGSSQGRGAATATPKAIHV
jgi:hypothetical protein